MRERDVVMTSNLHHDDCISIYNILGMEKLAMGRTGVRYTKFPLEPKIGLASTGDESGIVAVTQNELLTEDFNCTVSAHRR